MAPVSVLLVDDNTTFLRILKNFLQEHWNGDLNIVGTATNGEEALEKITLLKPQLLLLDLVMPGMSGLQVLPRLKQASPQTQIVVLTLLNSPDYRRASLAAGADDFVAKENLDADLRPVLAKIIQAEMARSSLADKSLADSAASTILVESESAPAPVMLAEPTPLPPEPPSDNEISKHEQTI